MGMTQRGSASVRGVPHDHPPGYPQEHSHPHQNWDGMVDEGPKTGSTVVSAPGAADAIVGEPPADGAVKVRIKVEIDRQAKRFRPKAFMLIRQEDETGVSGTGVVAVGVEFEHGICVLTWNTPPHSVAIYPSMADIINIHGHNGKTIVMNYSN